MRRILNLLMLFLSGIYYSFASLFECFRQLSLKPLIFALRAAHSYYRQYVNAIRSNLGENTCGLGRKATFNDFLLKKMSNTSRDLHSLLPRSKDHSYSVFINANTYSEEDLKLLLESAAALTAPYYEVLVGVSDSKWGHHNVIDQFSSIRKIVLQNTQQSHVGNALAKEAKGNFFLIINNSNWLRPDLLFRFEQTLYFYHDSNKVVLFSDEYLINNKGHFGEDSYVENVFHFPYVFSTHIPACLLVSKSMWDKNQGYRLDCGEAALYDFVLRLDLNGAEFHKIEIPLHARKAESITYSTDSAASQRAYQDYLAKKEIHLTLTEGYQPGTIRGIPQVTKTPAIHAIIPYKDQKEMTIKAVKSLLNQHGVKVYITAVDNRSSDLSITGDLEALGVEVIRIDEPFNFSRLNNLAVLQSKYSDVYLVFFMNNDVEMNPDALLEMAGWIEQPKIGIVGARLHYPNGTLQCGGVDLDPFSKRSQVVWDLTENKLPFEKLNLQKRLRVVQAITGAAALMKRDMYIQLGGFDEIWYPISYSDTSLARKIQEEGMYAFYTPYAVGTHYESLTRYIYTHEDYEFSTWLENKYFQFKPYAPLKP